MEKQNNSTCYIKNQPFFQIIRNMNNMTIVLGVNNKQFLSSTGIEHAHTVENVFRKIMKIILIFEYFLRL